jgi:oligoendopeptidase F
MRKPSSSRTLPRLHACALAAALFGLVGMAQAQGDEEDELLADTVSPAAAATAAPAADPKYVWDLSPIFANDAAWEAERQALLAELPALKGLQKDFGRSPATLRKGLDQLSAASQRLRRVAVYASAMASTDNRNARNQERSAQSRSLMGQYGAAVAWVDGAIAALGDKQINAWLKAEPGLARHSTRLQEVLREAKHKLHPEAEAALAALGPVLNSQGNTRTLLTTVDMEWPSITVDGKPVRVDNTGYNRLRAHPDRKVRQQAFEAFYRTNGRFENTMGSTLAQRVEAGVINARLRGYPSAVAASLSDNAIPENVYRTLVAETQRGLPTLHRYFKLRQKMLGLPDLGYHDIYPELVKTTRRYTPEVAAELTLASVAPLGAPYQAQLKKALGDKTMHVYPAAGKSPGAYQSGVYGMTPLVFLNHQDTFGSVSTYAHEWGHGMHTVLADSTQPPEKAGYPLFLAEIAAFTHELLLQGHVLNTAKSKEERLFYLGEAVERLRGAFFRQTMFAEFELKVHDALERGEAVTGKRMTQIYCGLLKQYHGAEAGVMAITPEVCSEWAVIPHFYRPFYVYQYATSMAAAHHFSTQLLAGTPGARDTYLAVLKSGGSRHPVPLLKDAGLDMNSPAPYRALVAQMDKLLDEMEKLLAEGTAAAAPGQTPG